MGIFYLILAIPFIVPLLFSVPLSWACIKVKTDLDERLVSVKAGDQRIFKVQLLWRRLRWWILFWSIATVAFLWLVYLDFASGSAMKRGGPLLCMANAAVPLFYFCGLFPYAIAVCFLKLPPCRRWRSLFLWTHFGGGIFFALGYLFLEVSLHSYLSSLYFELPATGYNPGFPSPEAALTYSTGVGVVLACVSVLRYITRLDDTPFSDVERARLEYLHSKSLSLLPELKRERLIELGMKSIDELSEDEYAERLKAIEDALNYLSPEEKVEFRTLLSGKHFIG
jgi:hypothetical protein